ncbi:MAG TPA: DedA family protein [Candidatus Binataceae bacterium]|nr:DedA family protein [Candidatus Binataceae bacterium]
MPHVLSPSELSGWLSTWGYLGIFVCVFIGNLGVPVPEETVLLVAGFLAGRGDLELRVVYVVGVGSAVTGDCCGFLFGRTSGQRLFESLARRYQFVRRRYDRLQDFFKAHGAKAVFMARFVAGARFLAGPMAGAAGMSFVRFLGWNLLGALVWCLLVISVGYLVGDELEAVAHVFHLATQWIALAVFLALVGFWLLWRERQQRRSET